MEVGELALGVSAGATMAFTLGASVALRLEGRRPLTMPLWLAIARGLSFFVMTLFIVVTADPPTGAVVNVDPLLWNVVEVLVLAAGFAVLVLEPWQALRASRRGESPPRHDQVG